MKKYFSESEKKIHFSVYFSELHTIYIYIINNKNKKVQL